MKCYVLTLTRLENVFTWQTREIRTETKCSARFLEVSLDITVKLFFFYRQGWNRGH